MNDYEFTEEKLKDLTENTESTSAIATIVYEVENAKFNNLENTRINEQINDLKRDKKFPPNLKLIGIEYDPDTSFCAVAFQDTDTGLVTVGTAGTNLDNGFVDSIKDVSQWGEIAFNGESASTVFFKNGKLKNNT